MPFVSIFVQIIHYFATSLKGFFSSQFCLKNLKKFRVTVQVAEVAKPELGLINTQGGATVPLQISENNNNALYLRI